MWALLIVSVLLYLEGFFWIYDIFFNNFAIISKTLTFHLYITFILLVCWAIVQIKFLYRNYRRLFKIPMLNPVLGENINVFEKAKKSLRYNIEVLMYVNDYGANNCKKCFVKTLYPPLCALCTIKKTETVDVLTLCINQRYPKVPKDVINLICNKI